MQHVEAIGHLATDPKDRPLQPVLISHCGELERRAPAARPRSPSHSASISASSASDSGPERKKRKHRSEDEKAAKRAKKEAKRARKEEKRARKKLKKDRLEAAEEPGPEEPAVAAARSAKEDAESAEQARLDERAEAERRRDLERLKEKLAKESQDGQGVNCASLVALGRYAELTADRGRGEMRFRESGSGMRAW
jgi:peptidyl-prolyl isomerase G (cyclophilin G)